MGGSDAVDLFLDGEVEGLVPRQECHLGPGCSVVVAISCLDPVVDEEPKDVGREVEGEDDEVDPVVVVEEVDADSGVVELLALHPEQTFPDEENMIELIGRLIGFGFLDVGAFEADR